MNTQPATPFQAARRRSEHGAATLIVVMLLFFLTLLVSAYASRTLVFEQRTSANQYRATQAHEAAQGGLEWLLAMLNSPQPLDAQCQPSNDVNDKTFRERLLAVDLTQPTGKVITTSAATGRVAGCALSGGGWQCACPTADAVQLRASETGSAAFIVNLEEIRLSSPMTPLNLRVAACTNGLDSRCYSDGSGAYDGYSRQQLQAALLPALRYLPPAALTVTALTTVAVPSNLRLVNLTAGGSALTLRANMAATPETLVVAAGMPPEDSVLAPDASLVNLGGTNEFFPLYTGLKPLIYRRLPGVRKFQCGDGDCSTEMTAAANYQLLSAQGNLTLPSGTTLGSEQRPVVLVVEGRLTLQGSTRITGFVYAAGLRWQGATASDWIQGAVQIGGDCCAEITGTPSIVYHRDVLRRLQASAGAYARVPGSWLDQTSGTP